ncbi:MAG: phosphatidylglycerophosphatase A [Planctomycetota bacterium]
MSHDVGVKFLGSFFGLGLAPFAPGTFGTLGGVLLGWLALEIEPGAPTQTYLGVAFVVVFGIGIVLGNRATTDWGTKDPGGFVIDEVAGYLVALFLLPLHEKPWLVLGGAFVAFRLFDITKPPPCRRAEFAPAGTGIMLDDVIAGIYANLVMQVVVRL